MMKKNYYLYFLSFVFLFSACDNGFEELNTNPFFPTQVESGPLFNKSIESLLLGWNEQFYLHNESMYGITQQAAITAQAFQNINIGTEEMWSQYYSALVNLREIERRLDEDVADQEATHNVRAQLLILRAYKTFRLTDIFGDIPYFNAGKGFQSLEYLEPAFDSQESIYKSLLDDLAWANDHMNLESQPFTENGNEYLSFEAFDNLFFGDLSRWIKFANSLRLRHALRMYEADPDFAGNHIAMVLDNQLPILEAGEDVVLIPRSLSFLKQSTHWSFREHKKLRMGSTIWNVISENDEVNGSGIFDPRAHFWFEPNNENEWSAFPQIPNASTLPSGGFPYQNSRDVAYTVKGGDNIYSPINYYLIRDELDVPEIVLTSAEIQFIQSEIYLLGYGVSKDETEAKSHYNAGFIESVTFWQNIMTSTEIWETKPPILEIGEIFSAGNHPNILVFQNIDNTEILKRIHTQRWLDAFRQPWEAYALGRRTLNTPRTGDPIDHFRYPYPPSEQTNNPNEYAKQLDKMTVDNSTIRVWWMN